MAAWKNSLIFGTKGQDPLAIAGTTSEEKLECMRPYVVGARRPILFRNSEERPETAGANALSKKGTSSLARGGA